MKTRSIMKAGEIAILLAERIDQLVRDVLPTGHREGQEWRCGSVAGEPGNSLGVHLVGHKHGVWSDFSTDQKGDALDLVRAVLGLDMPAALRWSRQWLGIEDGISSAPARPFSRKQTTSSKPDSHYWRKAWNPAAPMPGSLAESYLHTRGL